MIKFFKWLTHYDETYRMSLLALEVFSALFLLLYVPALICGFFDKEFFGLFLIVGLLTLPQVVTVWICTWKKFND